MNLDKDILDCLGDANSDRISYEVSDDTVRVKCWLLMKAIEEIKHLRTTIDRLRSVAGPVSLESGLTFSDIKKSLKANG